jgi:hypothetical protein
MTTALPPLSDEMLAVVDRYRTCEFATLSKSGVPMAWPTVVLRRPDGTFLITTSIALPQKAYNVRRDPRVALLFSEPTASGLEGAPQVLVQGTATCPDEIVTDIRGNEEYWRRLLERQPSNRRYSADPLSRRLLDWYYMRLLITVTPTAVSTRPPLSSGPVPVSGDALDGVAGDALRRLATFPSAVLGTRDEDGLPRLQRVRVTGPADGAALALGVDNADDLRPGPASLLAHSHDEKLSSQRNVAVLGDLTGAGTEWGFAPQRVIPGMGETSPLALFRTIRDLRRTARGYLERRSLPRPEIPWADVRDLKAGATAAGTGRGGEPEASRPPSR